MQSLSFEASERSFPLTCALLFGGEPPPAVDGTVSISCAEGGHEKEKEELEQELQIETKRTYTWSRTDTLKLIELYKENEHFLTNVRYKKKSVWESIAKKMQDENYNVTPIQCENKWKSLTSAYRRTVDHNSRTGTCRVDQLQVNKCVTMIHY